jgi:PKD repeat protein
LDGYANTSSGIGPEIFTISGIPYSSYDLYVYLSSDMVGRTGTITDGNSGTTYDFLTIGQPAVSGINAVLIQTTDTTGANPAADYAVFYGLTGSSDTLTLNIANGGGIAGFQIVAASVPPTAGFSSTPTNGFAPLQVAFTDASTGSITNWVWNFGNGNSVTNSSNASVTNTYAAAGTYTATLIVSGTGGSSTNMQTGCIAASPKPVFGGAKLSDVGLVLSGSNCPVGVQYRILTSTNVALPVASWTQVFTNNFAPGGSYGYTNSPLTNRASFFRLVSP